MTEPTASRITVSLTRKADENLGLLVDSTGMSKTDLVNRAIQLLQFVTEVETAGGHVQVRWADGDVERVRFL